MISKIEYLIDLAASNVEQGKLEEAKLILDQLLKIYPNNSDSLVLLGVIHAMQRNFKDALKVFKKADQINSKNPILKNNLANVLKELGRHEEALQHYTLAITLQPNYAEAYNNRGNLLQERLSYQSALESYQEAIKLQPDYAEAYNNLGNNLFALRRNDEALRCYKIAISLKSDYIEAYHNLAALNRDVGHFEEALNNVQKALEIDPFSLPAMLLKGSIYSFQGDSNSAFQVFQKIIEIDSHNIEAWHNLGLCYAEHLKSVEALSAFGKALSLNPLHIETIWSESLVNLRLGNLLVGWKGYESRWLRKSMQDQFLKIDSVPLLTDLEILDGKKILIWSEQGFGDVIQFSRYISLLAAKGATISFKVPSELLMLFSQSPQFGMVATEFDFLRANFDYHCPLLSLPHLFKTDFDSIPSAHSYLSTIPSKVEYWKNKIALVKVDQLNVGLVWSGGFRSDKPEQWAQGNRRDIPLKTMAFLKNIKEVNFFSLQKGNPAEQELIDKKIDLWPEDTMYNFTEELKDFSDTAALIENLDLVISVDTAVAHLAAALGKPVWLLNRFESEWRWFEQRKDSPWYPSMKIYNQTIADDWESVIRQVATDLEIVSAFAANKVI